MEVKSPNVPLTSIQISIQKIKIVVIVLIILFAILHGISTFLAWSTNNPSIKSLSDEFNLDKENNMPTFYATALLLISSLLLFIISRIKMLKNDLYRKHWSFLSVLFLLLALDEASSLHERLVYPLRRMFNLSGIFYFSWVIVGIIAILILTVTYIKFIIDLPRKAKVQFIIAAVLFVGGALGVELIAGAYASSYTKDNLTFDIISAFEEILEMSGIAVFINALLQYLSTHDKGIVFHFK